METIAYLPHLQNQFGGYGGEAGVYFPWNALSFNAINPYTGFTNYIPFENQSFGPAFTGAPSYIGIPNQTDRLIPFHMQRSQKILFNNSW